MGDLLTAVNNNSDFDDDAIMIGVGVGPRYITNPEEDNDDNDNNIINHNTNTAEEGNNSNNTEEFTYNNPYATLSDRKDDYGNGSKITGVSTSTTWVRKKSTGVDTEITVVTESEEYDVMDTIDESTKRAKREQI